jgi:hypothetical protein
MSLSLGVKNHTGFGTECTYILGMGFTGVGYGGVTDGDCDYGGGGNRHIAELKIC